MKILNRIVTFILGLAVFPAIFYRVLLRAVVSIAQDSTIYKLLSAFSETVDRKMEITVSIKDAIGYIQDGQFDFAGFNISLSKIPKELLVTKNWLIATAVLIAVSLLTAIIIMGCALFAQAHKTVMSLSAGAIACLFAAIKCFGKFAAPFTDGTIDLGTILVDSIVGGESSSLIASFGSAAMKNAISVDILQLGNAVFTLGIIFLGILLWTLAYYITLPKDKNKKVK